MGRPSGLHAKKTRGELFPSKEALEAIYATPRNYADLEHDRVGENLLQKHRYAMFRARPALADLVLKRLSRHLAENGCLRPEDEDQFALIRTRAEAMEWLLAENPVTEADALLLKVDYDVLAWREAEEGSLASFRLPEAQEIAVYYPREVIERFERSIADGGTQDFAKARPIYRLGIEALLPVQAPTRLAADAQMAHARTNGNFAYAPKFLAPGD